MSLIDISLRPRARKTPTCRPYFEVLEERQCPSVAAPTGLHATAISTTQIKLNWNDVANETGFRVYEWNGTQTIMVANLGKGALTYTVPNLTANTSYYFSVASHDLVTTAQSAWVPASTPADPITVPTNVHLTNITATSMTLQWNKATGATGYNVYGWDGAHAVQIGSTASTVFSFNVTGLSAGVTYFFYVQAVNKTNSANSDWVSAATLSVGIKAPANFKALAVNASTIGLSWTNVTNATGFKVYIWDGNNNDAAVLLTTLVANTTGYQATGLLPGTNYWFYVQAFNAVASANTPWLKATTIAAAPLQAPGNVAAVANGPNSAVITWMEPARAVGYNVYVWTAAGWSLYSSVAAGTHKVTVTGLMTNQTVWFYVAAFTANFAEVSFSPAVFVNL